MSLLLQRVAPGSAAPGRRAVAPRAAPTVGAAALHLPPCCYAFAHARTRHDIGHVHTPSLAAAVMPATVGALTSACAPCSRTRDWSSRARHNATSTTAAGAYSGARGPAGGYNRSSSSSGSGSSSSASGSSSSSSSGAYGATAASAPPAWTPERQRQLVELLQETASIALSTGPRGFVRALQGASAVAQLTQEYVQAGAVDPPERVLRKLFERLGATYIKLGQFIASSPSLFPDEYVLEFQKCLDKTDPVPFSDVKSIIEQVGKSLG
eukprot:362077-Chlamydomonas_euryale.AAC.6